MMPLVLLVLLSTCVVTHAADIPERTTILMVGGPDAGELTGTSGLSGLLGKDLRKLKPRRYWKFTHLTAGKGSVRELIEPLQQRLADEPGAIILQVGQVDAWDTASDQARTELASYQADLERLVAVAIGSGAPVIIGTPLLIGERRNGANPADSTLAAVAKVNRSIAAVNGLPIFDARATLTAWLDANNDRDKAKGLLTTNGTRLRRSGQQLLVAPLGTALGLSIGAAGDDTGKARTGGGVRPAAHSTVMIIGDKVAMKGTITGGRTKGWPVALKALQQAQWPDHPVTLYMRLPRAGAELFTSAAKLNEHVQQQVVALQPAVVILMYGFISCDPQGGPKVVNTPLADELTGLKKAVQTIRAAGCRVVLVPPIGGGDAARTKRSEEAVAAIRALATATGAEFSSGNSAASKAKNAYAIRDTVITHAVAKAIGLDPNGAGSK